DAKAQWFPARPHIAAGTRGVLECAGILKSSWLPSRDEFIQIKQNAADPDPESSFGRVDSFQTFCWKDFFDGLRLMLQHFLALLEILHQPRFLGRKRGASQTQLVRKINPHPRISRLF